MLIFVRVGLLLRHELKVTAFGSELKVTNPPRQCDNFVFGSVGNLLVSIN